MENKFKKLSKKYPELKWCIDFILINEDFEEKDIDFDEFIKTIPENERELYVWDKSYIIPNWDGIYYKLFNERLSYKEFKILKCDIPYGMKEFFEIDEQGNPTVSQNYKDGELQSEVTYYRNGQIETRKEIIRRNGRKHVEVSHFDEDGNKIR